MKASRYNRFFKAENNGRWLAFNGMTGALAVLDNEDKYLLVKQILKNPDQVDREDGTVRELWDNLVKGGYLTEDWIDEVELLKVRNRTARFQNYGLSLTIAPTMNCNFECKYCYEEPVRSSEAMSAEIEESLVERVRDRLRPKEPLGVTWYGGEPLLCLTQILRLTEQFEKICQERESSYSATIITNGYLLDQGIAKALAQAHVHSAQITLDGPRETHDETRPLKNGRGTYERILANVEAAVNGGGDNGDGHLRIVVRVNVDKDNADRIPELLDDLERRGLKNKIGIYLAQVKPYTDVCGNIGGKCFSDQEYTATEVELYRQFLKKGFRMSVYPSIRTAYCMADSCQNAFVVGPGGELYGCWSDIGGTNIIGHLLEEKAVPHPRLLEFLSWDPFEKQRCRECDILPICMGGCPYEGCQAGPSDGGVCLNWKSKLVEMLQMFYTSKVLHQDVSAAPTEA